MFSDLVHLTYEERSRLFADPDAAREYIEAVRWSGEPFCPHCGNIGAYALRPKPGSTTRKGIYKCAACRKQFSVTVGTVFEGSHLGLHKWLRAIYLMCASKKGISANQLCRELQVQYKTAWFLCHRIRKAMEKEPLRSKLGGPREEGGRTVAGQCWQRSESDPVQRLETDPPRARFECSRELFSLDLLGSISPSS